MNLSDIIEEIGKKDQETFEKPESRRALLKNFTGSAGRIALTALPFALGSIFEKTYANPPSASTVLGVLNYALTLEYLEEGFYVQGLGSPGLIPTAADRQAITTIRMHETSHASFLYNAIVGAGGKPISKPKFDYSGGGGSGNGPFKNAFSSYDLFLAVAQALEDTGVRAYKGQAPALVKGGTTLTAALNIHSVEARHASHIRQMRKTHGFAEVKPWITLNQSGISGGLADANYAGEENLTQAGIEIDHIGGFSISTAAASEAFDEPLTMDQVLALVKPFLAA